MRRKSWSFDELEISVKNSSSIRQVISKLGLKPTGGNYRHIQKNIKLRQLDCSHFTGQGWNVGLRFVPRQATPIKELLKLGVDFQSYKLKKRLFKEGLKKPVCELCGWSKMASDGRVPVELDHINGNKFDNRLENLRILCPNCHSLQPTHRGLNKVK